MEIQKNTGIVLSSRPAGDSDVLSIILTRDFGKRKFIFKGLKKSRKRSAGAAEPGSVTDLLYYYHPEWESYIVNEFTVQRIYHEIRNNLEKIYNLYFILESVEKTTGFNDMSTRIFELLFAAIEALSSTDHPIHLSAFFMLHLLRIHGILPSFKKCKICGSERFAVFALDADDLIPVCNTCADIIPQLATSVKKFIDESLLIKFSAMNYSAYDTKSMRDLIFSILRFIENYFHAEIKSKEFILSGI